MGVSGLAFLMIYAGGLMAALMRGPIYGLCTYVLIMFLHPPSRWWGAGLPWVRWSLVAAVVSLLAYMLHPRKEEKVDSIWRYGVFVGYTILVIYMIVQSGWAIWPEKHLELLELYLKYLVMIFLFYRTIDSNEALRSLLWSFVLGSFYISWVAFTEHSGGRFEDFGGPDIGEANAGGLTLACAVFAGGALFLEGKRRTKLILLALMPFIVNGIILTSSRSATLALAVGGLLYLRFTPKVYRGITNFFAVLAVFGFLALASQDYLDRMSTLLYAGQDKDVVTESGQTYNASGSGRKETFLAQWEMFKANPLGHGHRGTAALSPLYLDDAFLTGPVGERARSSHNTFMTALVEHGVLGATIYAFMVLWVYTRLKRLVPVYRNRRDLRALMIPTLAAVLGGITVGDLFVDYFKYEPRLWFISMLFVMLRWARHEQRAEAEARAVAAQVAAPPRQQLAARGY